MLEAILEQAGELPSLPEVYIRVTELLESESTTADEIGETLQTDPALTGADPQADQQRLLRSAQRGDLHPAGGILTRPRTVAAGPAGLGVISSFQGLRCQRFSAARLLAALH